jgi:uracil-DNA glycosylase family 4
MKAEDLGASCSTCPLATAPYVPTKHPQGAAKGGRRIAVVGEAPGFYEATYGEPFYGPSGKLLTQVLRHNGVSRNEVMLTNVCLCRPEGNANPPKAAAAACRPRLLRELADAGVDDIIAVGGTAATSLVDDPGTITSLRVGPPRRATRQLRELRPEADIRVISTWHPAYCLRNADAFPAFTNDIAKLKGATVEPWSEPHWRAFEDPDQALQVIGELAALEGPLVVDIEVGFDKDEAFDHPNNYSMLCVGIAYARGRAVVLGERALTDPKVVDGLRVLLRSKRLIAHNGKFDLEGLWPLLGGLELWADTMLASYCLDERPGNHGLKVLAVEKLGAPRYDDEIKKYVPRRGNYADIPRPILYRYNAYDVACTWLLWEMFERDLHDQGLREVHDFLVRASNQLMYLELNGIAIDREYMRELESQYLERLGLIEEEIGDLVRSSTGHLEDGPYIGINPRSPMQVKAYLGTQSVHVLSTNEDTLTRLLTLPTFVNHPQSAKAQFVRTLLRYRREHKLYSTYVAGIKKRLYRGRIYTTYMLHGTTSGRLASRNPNLQNIVRDKAIRKQFSVTKPGNVLIQADYKQAEARVMASLAQDEYLRSILSRQEEGYDFFNELSDQLYGAGQWGKEERIRTKAFFYGIGYGREAFSIGIEYGLVPREAQKLYDDFTGLIPDVVAWQAAIKAQVLRGEPLVSPFGRQRRFYLVTEQNKREVFNEALSYLPQSTASDICLSALIRLRPLLRGMAFIRLTIHDAIVVECEEVRQEYVAEVLRQIMVEEGVKFTDYVPFPVDVSFGKSWGDL